MQLGPPIVLQFEDLAYIVLVPLYGWLIKLTLA